MDRLIASFDWKDWNIDEKLKGVNLY